MSGTESMWLKTISELIRRTQECKLRWEQGRGRLYSASLNGWDITVSEGKGQAYLTIGRPGLPHYDVPYLLAMHDLHAEVVRKVVQPEEFWRAIGVVE